MFSSQRTHALMYGDDMTDELWLVIRMEQHMDLHSTASLSWGHAALELDSTDSRQAASSMR